MAHKEACQLYIEQEIQEGLKEGKAPYSIGKDLSAWVEKLFEAQIPAETIKKRAQREKIKMRTNAPSEISNENQEETQENSPKHPGGRPGKYAILNKYPQATA